MIYDGPGVELQDEHFPNAWRRLARYAYGKTGCKDPQDLFKPIFVCKQEIMRLTGIEPGEYRRFIAWAKVFGLLRSDGQWWRVCQDENAVMAPRYRVSFDMIKTHKIRGVQADGMRIDEMADMDIRQIFSDMAIKAMTETEKQILDAGIKETLKGLTIK